MSFLELSVSKLWHHGPEWLSTALLSQHETSTLTMPEECVSEIKKTIHTLLTTETKGNIEEVIDCRQCSTLSHLMRVIQHMFSESYNCLKGVYKLNSQLSQLLTS